MIVKSVQNVILGAGAMGSAAAYHLARAGRPVVLVEQFGLGHDRGSSHGAARITRHSYSDPAYARLMIDAFRAWRGLEADAGRAIYLRTGGVSICHRSVDYVERVAANLAAIEIPHLKMNGLQWNRCSPTFRLSGDHDVVFEPDAGMILASDAIRAQVELARQFGGDATEILERSPVRRIDLDGHRPRLVFDDFVLEAERLIVTAGGWTGRLLPEFATRLQPTRQQVLYFRPTNLPDYSIGRFPVFIYKGTGELDSFYGMPASLEMGVKVARHGGPSIDPDAEDRTIDPAYVEEVRSFLGGVLPSLGRSTIDHSEVCIYTMTEDEGFRLGPLPGRPDVIVASPCSGHGFKFSCLIGRVLADLAIEGETSVDIAPWRFG